MNNLVKKFNRADETRERIFARRPELRAAWEQEQELAPVNLLRRRFHVLTEDLDQWELQSLARWLAMWKR